MLNRGPAETAPRYQAGSDGVANVRYWPKADCQKSAFAQIERPLYTRKRPLGW